MLKLFISLAVPAICTLASAETPAVHHSFGVTVASPSSSLWRAEDDKSYNYNNRLLQEVDVQTTTATVEVDEDHDDHDHEEEEEGHDEHKDELVVVSYEMNTNPAMSHQLISLRLDKNSHIICLLFHFVG